MKGGPPASDVVVGIVKPENTRSRFDILAIASPCPPCPGTPRDVGTFSIYLYAISLSFSLGLAAVCACPCCQQREGVCAGDDA